MSCGMNELIDWCLCRRMWRVIPKLVLSDKKSSSWWVNWMRRRGFVFHCRWGDIRSVSNQVQHDIAILTSLTYTARPKKKKSSLFGFK